MEAAAEEFELISEYALLCHHLDQRPDEMHVESGLGRQVVRTTTAKVNRIWPDLSGNG